MLLNAGNGADEEQVENSLAEVAVGGLSDQLWSGAEDAHDADVAQVAQAGRRGKKRDRGGVGSRLSEDEGVLCETSNVVVDWEVANVRWRAFLLLCLSDSSLMLYYAYIQRSLLHGKEGSREGGATVDRRLFLTRR